jgi:GlpG protein
MRLVATFEEENLAKRFSLFLEKEKIENTFESTYDKKLKKMIYNIWVHDEDELSKVMRYYKEFISNPIDEKFEVKFEDVKTPQSQELSQAPAGQKNIDPITTKIKYPYKVTFFFLALCVILFFIDFMQGITLLKEYNLKQLVLLTPLQKVFLYDLPKQRLELDRVIIKYQLNTEEKLQNPPPEAKQAIQNIEKNSWQGLYDIILTKFQKKKEQFAPPSFEKIRHGEIWRLFTPTILHGGFLHIIFNMLWLWYLGKQMEPRLGFLRYMLFIIIVAVIANTAQYLMGGPYFLGFSGVITGMVGYIFVRQKIAPWEGYNIPTAVFYFIGIFIFAMFFLQMTSFVLQIFKPKIGFTPAIANTAHIVGIIIGMILAKIPFFTWRTSE